MQDRDRTIVIAIGLSRQTHTADRQCHQRLSQKKRRKEETEGIFSNAGSSDSPQILRRWHGQFIETSTKGAGAIHAPYRAMLRPFDAIEAVAHRVIGCAIEVHRSMGPGLLEAVYRECLLAELCASGLFVESEVRVPIDYKGRRLASPLKLDLLVDRRVVVEVKAIEALHPIHEAQVITYLKLTGHPAGLLMNFNEILLKNGLRRFDHPDRYVKKG